MIQDYPLNVAAPTDDSPFFFHMLRAGSLFKASVFNEVDQINLRAVSVLGTLLGILVVLSSAAIIAPLGLRRPIRNAYSPRLMVYFAAIGLAFMLVEIGQLERLILFLGHPIYGLTVVLFVVLIASSLGSLCSGRKGRWIWLLLPLLVAFIAIGPAVTDRLVSLPTVGRIFTSAVLIFPSGFFMGMAFPLGIERARRLNDKAPTAWYWAINGALSVISSVLAVFLAVFWGATVTLVAGLLAYFLALLVLFPPARSSRALEGTLT
jgi:hypothetical protein